MRSPPPVCQQRGGEGTRSSGHDALDGRVFISLSEDVMLTIFATPKPFRGHFAVIQRNALRSWTLLRPACEIILFGNEEGTEEIAQEFSVRHVSEVARNEHGTPLVNDMFEKASQLSRHDLICYLNADILLMSDFTKAVCEIRRKKRVFVMAGRRWNTDVEESLDFGLDWE